jgi:hypothetical protein
MRSLIAPLVPTVLRHLEAYVEVAGEDARDASEALARGFVKLLAAGACLFVALMMFCAWLLALAWDGPWRSWVAGGLALAFAAVAAGLALPLLGRGGGPGQVFFPRMRAELGRDRELLERAFNGSERAGASNGGDHAAE